jgi:hypothetical protein
MVRARDRCADVYCDATTQQLAKHKVLHLYCPAYAKLSLWSYTSSFL